MRRFLYLSASLAIAGCQSRLVIPSNQVLALATSSTSLISSPVVKVEAVFELRNSFHDRVDEIAVPATSDGGIFEIVSTTCGETLLRGESCEITIRADGLAAALTDLFEVSYRFDSDEQKQGFSLSLACGLVPALSPTIVTESASLPPAGSYVAGALTVPQYAGSASLTGIELVFAGKATLVREFENTGGSPTCPFNVGAQTTFTLNNYDGSILYTVKNPIVSDSGVLGANDGVIDFAGTGGGAANLPDQTAQNALLLNDVTNLAAYQGNGNISPTFTSAISNTSGGCGGLLSSSSTQFEASLTVNYETVPNVCDVANAKWSISPR